MKKLLGVAVAFVLSVAGCGRSELDLAADNFSCKKADFAAIQTQVEKHGFAIRELNTVEAYRFVNTFNSRLGRTCDEKRLKACGAAIRIKEEERGSKTTIRGPIEGFGIEASSEITGFKHYFNRREGVDIEVPIYEYRVAVTDQERLKTALACFQK